MREAMTTALDVAGLLLVAAGAGAAAFPVMEWAALAVSGAVVLAGSWLASRQTGRKGRGV
ncbi:hypothetical protein ACFOOM_07620 [Streptomyces echinoruber]|uniref:Uncharacterized protein n=2 Tax=Streptomyces echinoruber TaxID=68898 RepID=A0A918QYZ2_9ACTN|nr:hypothetical protein GCM10010389_17620 [Streptomyces echinoruber]